MIDLHYTEGLIPVVVQDAETSQVLMVAYANDEAVRLTKKTGFSHFYSRSRSERSWWTAMRTASSTSLNRQGPPAIPDTGPAFTEPSMVISSERGYLILH
jgi:hypothetical protein